MENPFRAKPPRVSVVVPIHNEARSLPLLVDEISQALGKESWEAVFVDDGSTDETPAVLSDPARRAPRLRVFTFRRNFGQTAALACGFENARGEVVVTLDADLQNDPSAIPSMIARLADGWDLVSGVRARRADSGLRRFVSRLANGLISWVTGVPIRDAGCSLKAYRREVLTDVHLYGEMHRFLPALVAWAGGSVTEMEVPHRERKYGSSHYPPLGRTWKVLLDLFVVQFLFSYESKPLYLFGGAAYLSVLGSLVLGAFVVGRHYLWGGEWISPLFFISAIMFGFGVLFLLLGLLADLVVRTWHESQGKKVYRLRS